MLTSQLPCQKLIFVRIGGIILLSEKDVIDLYNAGITRKVMSSILGISIEVANYRVKRAMQCKHLTIKRRRYTYNTERELLLAMKDRNIKPSDSLLLNIRRYYSTIDEPYGEQYVAIINMYEKHYSKRQIMKITKYNYKTVYCAISHYMLSEIKNEEFQYKKMVKNAKYLYNNGYSIQAIADFYGKSIECINNILKSKI